MSTLFSPHLASIPFGLHLTRLSVRELHYAELKSGGLVPRQSADIPLLKAHDWWKTLDEFWEQLQQTVNAGNPKDFKAWSWYLSSDKEVAACAKRWKGARVIAVSNWNPGSGQPERVVHDRLLQKDITKQLESFYRESIVRESEFNHFAKLGGLTFVATHSA